MKPVSTTTLLVALAACFSGVASAQNGGTGALRRAFAPAEDPVAAAPRRQAAIERAAAAESPAAVAALCLAWQRCDAELRPIEREIRKRMRRGGAKLAARERQVFDVLLGHCVALEAALRGMLSEECVVELCDRAVFAGDLSPVLRLAVVDRVAELPVSRLADLPTSLREARRPDDVFVLLRAAAACAKRKPDGLDAAVVARLADPERIVRLEAVRSVVALEHRAGVAALIDRLEVERGRPRRLLLERLEAFTGQNFGDALPSWRAWWRAEGEAFVRKGRPKKRRAGAAEASRTQTAAFFGVPQDGESILYVLDRSLSMRQSMAGGKGAKEGVPSRWERLLAEMESALGRLRPEQRFNVLTFGDDNEIWSKRIAEVAPRRTRAAGDWLAERTLQLGTNVFGALDEAFALAAPRIEDRYFEPSMDTILLLTDGRPTRRDPAKPGKLGPDDREVLLALARRRNPFGAVVVHTVSLGKGSAVAFLRELAAVGGGVCHVQRD